MSTHQEIFSSKSISDVVKKIISLKKEVVILALFANASVAEKNCIVIVQVSLDNLYGGSQIAVVYGLEHWK